MDCSDYGETRLGSRLSLKKYGPVRSTLMVGIYSMSANAQLIFYKHGPYTQWANSTASPIIDPSAQHRAGLRYNPSHAIGTNIAVLTLSPLDGQYGPMIDTGKDNFSGG